MNDAAGRNSPLRAGRIILLGIWFGLVTGLLEATVLAVRSYGLGHLIHISWHFPWMVPLADALFFLLPALVLALLGKLSPKLVPFRLVSFVFLALGLAAMLLMYPRILPWAAALLAIGLGFQLGRTTSRHRTGMESLVRRSLVPLVAFVILLAAGMLGYGTIKERRTLAGLPAARSGASVLPESGRSSHVWPSPNWNRIWRRRTTGIWLRPGDWRRG